MYKNVLKCSVLIFAIYLWLQAYSPFIYKEIGGKLRLFPDDYRYGDLYRLSLLPQFKEKAYECEHKNISSKQPISLYLIGDSFTEEPKMKLNDFPVEKYQYVHWAKSAEYQLDTTKKNILILETVERTFKEHFSDVANNFTNEKEVIEKIPFRQKLINQVEKIEKTIIPDGIEERLMHTIFNYDFFLWFRELKSSINLQFFNRTEDEVILSKNKNAIFFTDEADVNNLKSAFYPFSNTEVDTYVQQINLTRQKYLKAGFDEVYLSIIPNKVSILSPDLGAYNHLVEKIQTDKRLETPIIDTYSIFIKSPQKYYIKSDTHWTCDGREVWLEKVSSILMQQSKK